MSRFIPAVVALASLATLAGCQGQAKNVELGAFDNCNQFEGYMRKMAKREIAWDWGGFGGIGRMEFDLAVEDSAGSPPQAPGGITDGGATSYSTTNLQEEGVDEDDLMKTDGSYIYSLAGDSLVISRAWPLESAGQVSAINIDGSPAGLYLVGDKVIVLSNLWWAPPNPTSSAESDWRDSADGTVVTVVDISSLSEPRIVRETYLTGSYRESRIVDGELFVVTYEDIQLAWDSNGKADALRNVNRSELEDFQSLRFDNIRDGETWLTATNPACGCTETFASGQEGGTYVTTVSSLDLSDPLGPYEASAVVGRADTVYASKNSLYVGYTLWPDTAFTGRNLAVDTVLHKFDISADRASYTATAQVKGYINDSFSLSERDDVLFVAVTDEEPSNGIVALREEGGTFTELGRVEGLAPGEEIFAARFLGNLAYLVTYEVWLGDPLFTIDITDPENMRATGELAVTGFSNYLHPLDDDHLIAVGLDDAGGQSDWKLAVSLFDVSDLDSPQLKDRELLDAWGSEAQNEHHAFNYFAPTQSLSVPSWAWEGQTVLEVLHVDADEVYSLGQLVQEVGRFDDFWCTPIRRSVVMEDTLWALSAAGMTAAKVDAPEEVIAQVAYEGIDPCASTYYWEDRF